jgi:starch synthase (maltosyl-transferring)
MSGSALAASLRCRLQGAGRGWRRLIGAAKAVDPDIVFWPKSRRDRRASRCAAEAGFDYLFNSMKWWDFESPGCSTIRIGSAISRRRSPFPESHDTERLVTEPLAAGFPESEIEARYRRLMPPPPSRPAS